MVNVVLVVGQDRTCDTEADAQATIGRRSVREQGEAGYAALVLTGAQGLPVPVGAAVAINDGQGRPRHTGILTDTRLTHEDDPDEGLVAVQTCTSMGALARWGRRRIGDVPWPAESVAARAARIAALVGMPLTVHGGQEQLVVPRDVDSQPAALLVQELAAGTGGWVFDAPDGTVHLQALDARAVRTTTALWSQEPEGATWADLGPDGPTWDGDDAPGPGHPVVLDCTDVDWEPSWTQTLEIANIVTVEYGEEHGDPPQRPTVTVRDEASIALYGQAPATVKTPLALLADALELAGLTLARAARPQWHLESVGIDWDGLPPAVAAQLAGALPGTRCTVTGLPQPAPARTYPGVIEGWTEDFDPDAHRITLWLSHVAHSLALSTWEAEPPAATWADLDPALSWEDDL
jgi:hypothetical protein